MTDDVQAGAQVPERRAGGHLRGAAGAGRGGPEGGQPDPRLQGQEAVRLPRAHRVQQQQWQVSIGRPWENIVTVVIITQGGRVSVLDRGGHPLLGQQQQRQGAGHRQQQGV